MAVADKSVDGPWPQIIYGGVPADVDAYLDRGGNIERRGFNDHNPVLFAAYTDRWDIVLRLLNLGADPTVKDRRGIFLMKLTETSNVSRNSERGSQLAKVEEILRARGLLR